MRPGIVERAVGLGRLAKSNVWVTSGSRSIRPASTSLKKCVISRRCVQRT